MKNRLLLSCMMIAISLQAFAQINLWQPTLEPDLVNRSNSERYTTPTEYTVYALNVADLRAELASVPHERQISRRNSYAKFDFPMPDGSFRTFSLVEYDMMETPLARKFPQIKTYTGVDLEHGSKIHCNVSSDQFFAVIREKGVTYYIDPYYRHSGSHYISYDIRDDHHEDQAFYCEQHEVKDGEVAEIDEDLIEYDKNLVTTGKRGEAFSLKSYRLAVTAEVGFTEFYGDSVAGAIAGIVTIVNRINSIYEREVAVRMVLIGNNDEIVYTSEDVDPFEGIPTGDQEAIRNENQTLLTTVIGANNYDIGHVFNVRANATSGQGIAFIASVCDHNTKGLGASARPSPTGDAFTVAIISHEMGHQYSGLHTMYHCHNVQQESAFEPGSGSTIMSYAGICSPVADIVNFSEDYFHVHSLARIISYTRNGGGRFCGENIDFGNSYPDPIIDIPTNLHIPLNSPFKLTGSALDAETPESLTFCWEQYQLGSRNFESNPWNIANPIGNEPLFRSREPIPSSTRYFPALPIVVNQSNYLFEQLPTYARDMKFRMTVRDNASENGGAAWEEIEFKVHDNSAAGQFEITNFNEKDTIKSGQYVEVTWNVAATNEAPINTQFVNIYLSIDGGTSFPILLKEHTENDGSTFVNIPNVTADRFRFMIEADENIYYDVSDRSGLLCVDSATAAVGVTYNDRSYDVCAPEIITFDINTFGLGGFDDILTFDFTGTLPPGGFASFSEDQVTVGTPTTLTINLVNATVGGQYNIGFSISGNDIETQERSLDLTVTTNNFTTLTLNEPVDGSSGVEFIPTLAWSPAIDALSYTVQLSDQPDFSNIVFERSDITQTQVDVDFQLSAGTVYYWRVQPRNSCALHDLNQVSTFQIKSLACDEFCSTQSTITIPASGTHSIEMPINTGVSQTVSDLNITSITGRHNDMSQLRISIQGPTGPAILLLDDGSCPYNTNINMGFDDDAIGVFPDCSMSTTFNQGLRFEPVSPLSALNGQSGTDYKLLVEDIVSGQGGRLDGWCFEICSAANPEKPLLVRADSIEMPSMTARTVSNNKLEVTHGQYSASELTITIVEVPNWGTILIDGVPVLAGATLTMQDVIDDKLVYQNENDAAVLDHFAFIVTDPGGGFLGTPTIDFYVGGYSSTNETLPVGSELSIFPNPVSDVMNVRLKSERLEINELHVYTIQGQLISQYTDIRGQEFSFNTSNLFPGSYILQAKSGKFIETRKFIKE